MNERSTQGSEMSLHGALCVCGGVVGVREELQARQTWVLDGAHCPLERVTLAKQDLETVKGRFQKRRE